MNKIEIVINELKALIEDTIQTENADCRRCLNYNDLNNLETYIELLQQVNGEKTESKKALPIHIVRVCAWEGATAAQQEPFIDKAAELVQDTLFCSRVWSAWGYGTMTADDFSDAADDEDFIEAIAKAIWEGH